MALNLRLNVNISSEFNGATASQIRNAIELGDPGGADTTSAPFNLQGATDLAPHSLEGGGGSQEQSWSPRGRRVAGREDGGDELARPGRTPVEPPGDGTGVGKGSGGGGVQLPTIEVRPPRSGGVGAGKIAAPPPRGSKSPARAVAGPSSAPGAPFEPPHALPRDGEGKARAPLPSDGSPAAAAAGAPGAGLPANILALARQLALSGGPGAVYRFMAQQGYSRSGNWCAEFVAAVVSGAGGQPPSQNPRVATNWRRWGVELPVPVPGGIAVRRGPSTGSTGSHVAIVEGVDRERGEFWAIGGNQGRIERRFPIGRYQFYAPRAAPTPAPTPRVSTDESGDR